MELPFVSLVIVVHNGDALIRAKLDNALSLEYPREKFEIVLFSDGSTDNTERIACEYEARGVRFYFHFPQEGKNSALNKALNQCKGEIVFFSDGDAILSPNALASLARYFGDPSIGGVTGRRAIREEGSALKGAQSAYIIFDSFIKSMARDTDSNDGKLYAIRKSLFTPIPDSVTDDLYVLLAVKRAGYRFIYTDEATAYIRLPSRDSAHEIQRRRRIVSTSLRGIYLMRAVLNPFKYGMFSLSLFVNKVLRRMLPLSLILLFLSSAALSLGDAEFLGPLGQFYFRIAFIMQALFYLTAFFYPLVFRHITLLKINKLVSIAYYFCIGNYGMLLGVLDFATGKKVKSWTPKKN